MIRCYMRCSSDTRYVAGRTLAEDLLGEHRIAATDEFVSYLGRCIAAEHNVEPARAFEIGEAAAAWFIEERAGGGSTYGGVSVALQYAQAAARGIMTR
jgi:hypothetical protein